MKTIQLKGPFAKGANLQNKIKKMLPEREVEFVQIGIEVGTSIPYQIDIAPIIKVQTARQKTVDLKIGETCILEWDNFISETIEIMPLEDLDEYTIIDLAFQ